MKTLADLKRLIKPGVRLRCIANTYRPELNGRERVVVRVFTGQFTWIEPNVDHSLIGDSCSCGRWTLKPDTHRSAEEEFSYHKKRATDESWTRYEKASLFTFDGSNSFKMRLGTGSDYIHLEVL